MEKKQQKRIRINERQLNESIWNTTTTQNTSNPNVSHSERSVIDHTVIAGLQSLQLRIIKEETGVCSGRIRQLNEDTHARILW